MDQKFGLIGHGHFGQALAQRFHDSGLEGELLISEGRGRNVELLKKVDVLLICVRPQQMAELAAELAPVLKDYSVQEKCLVSFVAATALAAQEKAFGFPVVRAMSDLQFKQMVSMTEPRLRDFFHQLSWYPPIESDREESLEDYTVLIACLAGVVAWAVLHKGVEAERWLRGYWDFIQTKLSVSEDLFTAILREGLEDKDPAGTIFRMATPSGITESLVEGLTQNPDCSFENLYKIGIQRCAQIREKTGFLLAPSLRLS